MKQRQDQSGTGSTGKPSVYEDLPSLTNRNAGSPPQDVASTGHRGRGPKQRISSSRVGDDVIERLAEDEQLDASEILVMVDGDVVTLTGNVPDAAMKRRAEALAAAAAGVRELRNAIRVDDASASSGLAGEAVRSGQDQLGSGFSSSARPDPINDNPTDDSNWPAA